VSEHAPTPPVAAAPPVVPPTPRPSRRRAVIVTFLLTSVAALVIGRHVVKNVLPTRAWWVREELRTEDDPRARGAYFETVLYSRLSDEAKLKLLFEAFGNSSAIRGPLDADRDRNEDQFENNRQAFADLHLEARKLEMRSNGWSNGGNRLLYLGRPLLELSLRVLADPNTSRDARRHALYFLNALIELVTTRLEDDRSIIASFGYNWSTELLVAKSHLEPYLASADLSQKRLAVRALAAIGGPVGGEVTSDVWANERSRLPIPELRACLSDADGFVRFRAARALGYVPQVNVAEAGAALEQRLAVETDRFVREEIVYSMGLLGTTGKYDPRPTLVALLTADRRDENGWFKAHVLGALILLDSTPEAIEAARTIFNEMKPAFPQTDRAGLAATAYLGRSWRERDRLIGALRAHWAEYVKQVKLGRDFPDFGLFTLAAAVLHNTDSARPATSDLIRLLPSSHGSGHRSSLDAPTSVRELRQPFTRPRRWDIYFGTGPYDPWAHAQSGWNARLHSALAKLGPPAESDLPALRALLDYDGEGVTKLENLIWEVRRAAASALLRYQTHGRDARAVLQSVCLDPKTHPVVQAVAKEQLEALPFKR
jgi:HEAT repeat protein